MSDEDREKWNARYANPDRARSDESPFLSSCLEALPRRGRALDVAGGAGRNAVVLARHGLEVTMVDISEVGLDIARKRADSDGLTIETVARDLEHEPLPEGPWDVIVSMLFLRRNLLSEYGRLLAPGGFLIFLQPTVDNLERHPRPPRPFLLEARELDEVAAGLEVIHQSLGWTAEGQHEARLFARKPFIT